MENWWLQRELSLSKELQLEVTRREIKGLPRAQLVAGLDCALGHNFTLAHLLRQALARVQELEARDAIRQRPSLWRRLLGR